jgi:hypothetical protein
MSVLFISLGLRITYTSLLPLPYTLIMLRRMIV